MSNPDPSPASTTAASESNPAHTALFANLVIQQSTMAMVFLGKSPHPESGKTEINLEAAQLFIETLEMLENKTRGNLGKDEQRLLQQTLMSLRMAYVDAVNQPASPTEAAQKEATKPAAAPAAEPPPKVETARLDSESPKRFTKKY